MSDSLNVRCCDCCDINKPCGTCLERFAEALNRPDFSHVSYLSWCRADLLHVYRVDPESPTRCSLIFGIVDNAETRAVLAANSKGAQAGGQMGHAACVAGMRG